MALPSGAEIAQVSLAACGLTKLRVDRKFPMRTLKKQIDTQDHPQRFIPKELKTLD